jgi:hypothetical protein
MPVMNSLIRMKSLIPNNDMLQFDANRRQVDEQMDKLEEEYK